MKEKNFISAYKSVAPYLHSLTQALNAANPKRTQKIDPALNKRNIIHMRYLQICHTGATSDSQGQGVVKSKISKVIAKVLTGVHDFCGSSKMNLALA